MSSVPSDSRLASLVAKLSTTTSTDPSSLSAGARFPRSGGDFSTSELSIGMSNLGTFADVKMSDTVEERNFSGQGSFLLDSPMLYKLFCTPSSTELFSRLCKGVVGQGSAFCMKEDCPIKSHKMKKATIEPNHVYVMKQNSVTAFVEPVFNRKNVDDELYNELIKSKLALSDWTEKFSIINNVDHVVSKDTIEVEHFYAERMKAFKTPSKLDKGFKDKFFFLDITPYKKQTIDLDRLKSDDGAEEIHEILDLVDTGLEETSNLLIRIVAKQEDFEEIKNKELNSIASKLLSLEDTVGKRVKEVQEEYQAPTIWGSIALLASHIISVGEAYQKIDLNMTDVVNEVTAKSCLVARNVSHQECATLESNINNLRESLITSLESVASYKDRTDREFQNLRDDINNIRNVRARSLPSTSDGGSIFDTIAIQNEIDRVKKIQDEINIRFKNLSAQADKEAIKFCNLGFRTYQESSSWVEVNFPDYSFGLVMSMFTVLEHVHATFSGLPSLERLNQLYKLKIDDLNKGLAITSFDSRYPKYFMKSQIASNNITNEQSFFDRVPNYDVWEEPHTGFRDRLKEELETFGQGYNRMITNTLNPSSQAYTIAYNSVTTSIAFIESLIGFVDDIYRELTRAKFSKVKAWALVTRLIRRIFVDIAVPRVSVQNQFRTGQDDVICKQIFWAEIQALEIMGQFKALSFKDHPAIASEYVKFLVTNTGIESLEKLLARVSALEDKISELTKSAKAATTAATTASNKADEVKKSTADLLKRVTALERK